MNKLSENIRNPLKEQYKLRFSKRWKIGNNVNDIFCKPLGLKFWFQYLVCKKTLVLPCQNHIGNCFVGSIEKAINQSPIDNRAGGKYTWPSLLRKMLGQFSNPPPLVLAQKQGVSFKIQGECTNTQLGNLKETPIGNSPGKVKMDYNYLTC